jgi:Pyruvate/2-oxoacid:ferredoxin oxidoreductase delta subunit
MQGFELLLKDVIDAGLCTACGTCVAVCPKESITWDQEQEKAIVSALCKSSCPLCFKVCPGKDIPVPDLEKFIFGRQRSLEDYREHYLGISERCLQGYATDSKLSPSPRHFTFQKMIRVCPWFINTPEQGSSRHSTLPRKKRRDMCTSIMRYFAKLSKN